MNARNYKKVTMLFVAILLFAQTPSLLAAEESFEDWYNEQKTILGQVQSTDTQEQIDLLDLVTEACITKADDKSLTLDQQALIKLLEHEISYAKADWDTCWQNYDIYLGLITEAHDKNYAAGVVIRNGRILYDYKQFDDCREMFNIGLQHFADSSLTAEISFWLGKSLYKLQDYTGSKSRFEKLISDYHDSKLIPDAQVWLAMSLAHNYEYDRAYQVLDDVIKNHPDSDAAQYALVYKGDIYFAWHQWTDALFCYQEFFNKYTGSQYSEYTRKKLEQTEDNMLNLLDDELFK